MADFQVSARTAKQHGVPEQRSVRTRRVLQFILPSIIGSAVIVTLVLVLGHLGLAVLFFLLLPACVTFITAYRRLSNNYRQLALTVCLAFVYFSGVAGFELLTHGPHTAELIVVTTTLALAVLFEPVRNFAHSILEQRLHVLDTPARKAVEAYSSTLREEIELAKVRDGLLGTLEQALRPYSVALWVATPTTEAAAATADNDTAAQPATASKSATPSGTLGDYTATIIGITIADDDPFIAYALRHSGLLEIKRLGLQSPFVEMLRQQAMEIVLPLPSQGELLGLLALGPRLNGTIYSREDHAMLLALAQLALAQQQQAREHERIEQELRTAQVIQRTFLPKDIPLLPGWQLLPYYQPAREVGGDFYDFIALPDGRLGLVIGDVTGKGIPAALVMTATRTMLRAVAPQTASPGEVLAQVNELLRADIPAGMFVTCFYAVLDPASGQTCYANAGQDLPALRHDDGALGELRATGMPLGLLPGISYDEGETTLTAGDLLLFYSDGLVEAHNPRREMFGLPRLRELVEAQASDEMLIQALLEALAQFTGANWEQEDDVTLVTLQRLKTLAEGEQHLPKDFSDLSDLSDLK